MTNLTPKLVDAATNLLSAAGTNDIRAIKPPVEVPNPWAWLWWLAAASVLATAFLAWMLWRAKRLPPPIPVVPPHVRAKQKLAVALRLIGDPKAFCTAVADTVRLYLEERFNLRAPERTTEEFLVELQGSRHLLPDQKQSLGAFLQSCDLVKFARFEPTETALRELHDAALRLIDETQFEAVAASPNHPPHLSPPPPPPPKAILTNTPS